MEHEIVIKNFNRLLNIIGFMPNGQLNCLRAFLFFLPSVLFLFLAIYLLIVGDTDFEQFTNCIETIISKLHVLVKFLILLINYQKMQQLFKNIQDSIKIDNIDENSNIYSNEIAKIKLFIKCFISITIITIIILISPILSNELPMLFYVPKWAPNALLKLFIIYEGTCSIIIILTLDLFIFTSISLVTLQMKLLNLQISHLGIGEVYNNELVSCKIKLWVKAHINFYSNFNLLNSIAGWITLIECIIFIITMSFEFHLAVDRTNDLSSLFYSLSYIFTLMFEVFVMYCWPASQLKEEATKTLFYFYDTPWSNAPLSVQKSLLIIMTRLQRETVICFGNTLVVNLELFTNVTKVSYSYFTTLQTMQQVYSRE